MAHFVYGSIVAAFALIYLPRFFVIHAQAKQPEGFDNRHPRTQQAKLSGYGARAQGAHQNGFETFAPFAAGILACQVSGQNVTTTAWLGIAFVASRIVYIGLYLADLAPIRTAVWFVGFGVITALLVRPLL